MSSATMGLRLFYPGLWKTRTTLGLRLDVAVGRLASSKAVEQLGIPNSHYTICGCLSVPTTIYRTILGLRIAGVLLLFTKRS